MEPRDDERRLLERCLQRDPEAWSDFVRRFLPLVYRVIGHTVFASGINLDEAEIEDLAAEVMAAIVDRDFRVLRRFRSSSSLKTYLAVVARRIVVRQLRRRAKRRSMQSRLLGEPIDPDQSVVAELEDRDRLDQLLAGLDRRDAEILRRYYFHHEPYAQISREMGISQNSIGPILARLRRRLRQAGSEA